MQLDSHDTFAKSASTTARGVPLLPLAGAIIIGIILARVGLLSLPVAVIGALAALAGAGVFIFFRGLTDRSRRLRHLGSTLLLLAFVSLAALRYNLIYNYYPDNHIVRYCRSQPRLATITGAVITAPYITKTTGVFADFDYIHQPRTIFTLRCTSVQTIDGPRSITGLAHVVVKEPAPHLRLGQNMRFHCWLSLRGGPHNPGQFDRTDAQHAARKLVACHINNAQAITVRAATPQRPGFLGRLRQRLQALAYTALLEDQYFADAQSPPRREAHAFLAALLLGQRFRIDASLNEMFMRTGTIHFLSVSGLHVGLIAAFAWALAWLLRLPRFLRGLAALACIVVFVLIVPPRPPVIRAGITCSVFCLAYMARRPTNSINLLSLAAIILLLARPLDLFTAGFQLSFVVVLALLLFAGPLYRRKLFRDGLDQRILLPPEAAGSSLDQPWWQQAISMLLRYGWGLLAVALVAWIAGLPLTAYHFNRISLSAPLASVALFPFICASLFLGFAKLLLAPLLPALAALTAAPLNLLSNAAIFLVEQFARLPYSTVNTASPPIWFMLLFYLLLAVAGWFTYRRRAVPRAVFSAILIWAIALIWMLPFNQHLREQPTSVRPVLGEREAPRDRRTDWRKNLRQNQTTTLHVLAVGHGCAAIVELPDGKTICYDAGSTTNFNVASQTIMPFLRSRGIQRLDALFISHPNIDHYSGVVDLCRDFDVDTVYITEYFEPNAPAPVRRLLTQLARINQPIRRLSRGKRLHSDESQPPAPHNDYTIDVLWPPAAQPACQLNSNDSSLVLRIAGKNGSVILSGDIGEIPQQLLLERELPQRLDADILLLPHHGAVRPTLSNFVNAVRPELIVNTSDYLASARIDKLHRALSGRPLLQTYQHGAISVYLTPTGIKARAFH